MADIKYVFEGKTIYAPEDMPIEEVIAIAQANSAPQAYDYPDRPKDTKLDPNDLEFDSDWVRAAKEVYKMRNGEDFKGSDKDASQFGLEFMSWFNYNTVSMGMDLMKLKSGDTTVDQKKAFLHLLETYDQVNYSWAGLGRGTEAALSDPLNWATLSTFGLGSIANIGGKMATKESVKQMLKFGIQTGIENAVVSGVQDTIQQQAKIAAGGQESIDYGQVGTAIGIGGIAGGVLGAAGVGLSRAITGGAAKATGEAAEAVAARGATTLAGDASKAVPEPPKASVEAPAAQTKVTGPNPDGFLHSQPNDQMSWKVPGTEYKEPIPVNDNVAGARTPKPAEPIPDNLPKASNDNVIADLHAKTDGDAGSAIIKAVKDVAGDPNWRFQPTGRGADQAVSKAAEEATQLIQKLNIKNVDDAVRVITDSGMTGNQMSVLKAAISDAAESLASARRDLIVERAKNPGKGAEAKLAKIAAVQDAIAQLDKAASSGSGFDLGYRVGKLLTDTNRGLSVEDILRRKGFDPELATPKQKETAEAEFVEAILARERELYDSRDIRELGRQIDAAVDAGDFDTAVNAAAERKALVDAKLSREAQSDPLLMRAYKTVSRYINEIVISNAFSVATVVVNVLPVTAKTIYKPLLDYIVRGPFDNAAFKGMLANYSAMGHSMGFAARGALLAFRMEKSLLLNNPNAFLDFEPAIKGFKGRLFRFFPRILNAQDEFFSQMHYRGFVNGEATFNAINIAKERGLKGKDFDTFVSDYVKNANAAAFDNLDTPNVVQFLREKGVDRGYSGERLANWVKTELTKNKDLFIHGKNREGMNYAEDILYKRKFSGDSSGSKMAAAYERFLNDNALFRVGFTLFFRTPIRLLEEGFRLTPVLQMVAPKFMDDFYGKNGLTRQIRAQGELMVSQALLASGLMLYFNGQITGGGEGDYRKRRTQEGGREWQPYTIYFSDGSTFNYGRFEPFATPIKMMVNAMDQAMEFQYRKEQGEYRKDPISEVTAVGLAATMAIVQTVKDQTFLGGINQFSQFVTNLTDPLKHENAWQRLANQKAAMFLPNIFGKVDNLGDGDMNDPKTLMQALVARVNPTHPLLPKQYDALGYQRHIGNPTAAFFGVGVNTIAEAKKGIPSEHLEVLKELEVIAKAVDTHFTIPFKNSMLPGVDLREQMTSDGKDNMFNRMVQYYKELGVGDAMHKALIQNKDLGTYGTPSAAGTKAAIAKQIQSSFLQAAFVKMLKEETGLRDEYLEGLQHKARAKGGLFD